MAEDLATPPAEAASPSTPDGAAAPEPRTDLALDFLERFRPGGPWVLTAIQPDRKAIETRTFRERAQAEAWIERHNGEWNLYVHVNPTLRDLEKKADKEEMAALAWLHVDIDPRVGEDLAQEQARARRLLTTALPESVPPTTAVVFSGGGYQGFWRLAEPFEISGNRERAAEAERWNRQLEVVFGADHCHNVDRIMRLPGTVNLPDARKRRKGRVPTLAELVEFHDDRVYDLSRFTPAPPIQQVQGEGAAAASEIGPARRLRGVDDLGEWRVPDRLKELCVRGHLRDTEGNKAGDDSRSAWLFDAVCGLVRRGVPDEVVLGVLLDPDLGIGESVLDKGSRAEAYARRQIRQAHEAGSALACDDKGRPLARHQDNVRVALARLGVRLSHNEFTDRSLVEGLPGSPS